MTLSQAEINSTIFNKAVKFLGVKEIAGENNNKAIVEMFTELGFDNFADEVPWCAAYVGYVLKECRFDYLTSLRARDYYRYGTPTNKPTVGSLAVFWRENYLGTKGHVGFFLHSDGTHIWVLGGNQSNQVSITTYPIARLLGYRNAVLPA